VGNEPFAVILADDLIDGAPPVLSQMVERFEQTNNSILGVETVEPSETASYGIVDTDASSEVLAEIKAIVEKPDPANAPSNLAVVGRYILTPAIFYHLQQVRPGKGGEIQLTDAIAALLNQEPVLAYRYQGTRYDCGSKLGYMKANVEFALRHPEIAQEFASYLASRT
jgi:UTP--glucose-1-phosphate uridylyltransferase